MRQENNENERVGKGGGRRILEGNDEKEKIDEEKYGGIEAVGGENQ